MAAISMCLMFVTFDLGHPERFWHLIPGLGVFNFPISLLTWDVVVLNVYLALNLSIPVYILWKAYNGEHPNYKILWPFIIFSVPAAVSIHTVTAFLYSALPGKALLERVDPGSPVPGLGLLLRPELHHSRLPDHPQIHRDQDQGRGPLQAGGDHRLRDGPEPVPSDLRSVQGILRPHDTPVAP